MPGLRTSWGNQKPPIGTPLQQSEYTENLIAAYLINEAGGKTLYDATGVYNATANTTPIWATDTGGSVVNGNNALANSFASAATVTFPASGQATILCWATDATINSIAHNLIAIGTYNTPSGFGIRVTTANTMKVWYTTSTITVSGTDTFTPDSKLHMWALTMVPGTTAILYRDGNAVASTSSTASAAVTSAILLGGNSTDATYWGGTISQAEVYSRALPASEIAARYANRYALWQPPTQLRRAWLAGSSGTVNGAANLLGNSLLTSTGITLISGAATLSGNSLLTATGINHVFGSCNLLGAGALTVTGITQLFGSASVPGYATLTATGLAGLFGVATLSGASTVTVAGKTLLLASASLAGTASVSATGITQLLAAASLSGHGALTATGLSGIFGVATMQGFATLLATGSLANVVTTGTLTVSATALIGSLTVSATPLT